MYRRLLILFLALALAATACGNGSDGEVTDPPGLVDETPTAAGEPTSEPGATTEPGTTPTVASTTEPATTPSPGSTTEPTTAPTATPAPAEQVLHLYWLRGTEIATSARTVETPSPASAALDALFAGPDAFESGLGFETALPDGVDVLGLTIADGVATVDLSSQFESVSFGTAGELAMVAQVVFTLTQFSTVDEVDIRIDGEVRDAILSHGLEATGLTRAGFYDAVAPGIVVERPFPGEVLGDTFSASGFSRTFESNVQWELTQPPGGSVISNGFTTASQPDVGVHGPFSFNVLAEGGVAGPARLTVFESSAEDGSRINVYEVPIVLTGEAGSPGAVDALAYLRVNGLGPVDFGATLAEVELALLDDFGPPIDVLDQSECGVGPVTIMSWNEFTLYFVGGASFEGWWYRASSPPMTTPSGVRTGMTRAEVEAIYDGATFTEDSLGPEFFFEVPAGYIGGFFTEGFGELDALYAGVTCFFR